MQIIFQQVHTKNRYKKQTEMPRREIFLHNSIDNKITKSIPLGCLGQYNLLKRTGVLIATNNEDRKRTSNSYRWSDAIEEQEANKKQLSFAHWFIKVLKICGIYGPQTFSLSDLFCSYLAELVVTMVFTLGQHSCS